jgi:ADP-dependent NAD(P)H-hydrate dehydratase / NAD(P)H-hydrate epimerase
VSASPWLEPLYDANEMRRVDAWAIEERGVPSLELMEQAGSRVADVAAERAPEGRVVVVAGKGNNGGDGLVVARLLRERGREVDVMAAGELAESTGDARANLDRLPGPAPAPWNPARLEGAALVIDAIFGTGFAGAPRDPIASILDALSAAAGPVLAVDVPSGVNASTGAVAGAAVRARDTVTFHAPKVGLWIAPGKDHAGRVRVVDIGVPAGAPPAVNAGLIRPSVLESYPRRGPGWTKFASGTVLVVGGSRGLTGAPSLVSEAAMRAGAGYVTAGVPASLEPIFEMRLLEVMTRGLPEADGGLTAAAADGALELAGRVQAAVVGPGAGRRAGTVDLVRRLARELPVPIVLDADGLNAHAGRLADLRERRAAAVLTPHDGELARLLGVDSDEVHGARLESARRAAAASGCVLVLKGDDTIVSRPDGEVAVTAGGAPALATAGTGDVLSGVVAALLSRGLDPFHAACAAVHAHQVAGRLAARARGGPDGVIASDVIAALPGALAG